MGLVSRYNADQWTTTYAGRPAVLWNPTFTAPLIVTGTFSSSVTGSPAIPVAVETRTSLLTGEWFRINTLSSTPGDAACRAVAEPGGGCSSSSEPAGIFGRLRKLIDSLPADETKQIVVDTGGTP